MGYVILYQDALGATTPKTTQYALELQKGPLEGVRGYHYV